MAPGGGQESGCRILTLRLVKHLLAISLLFYVLRSNHNSGCFQPLLANCRNLQGKDYCDCMSGVFAKNASWFNDYSLHRIEQLEAS